MPEAINNRGARAGKADAPQITVWLRPQIAGALRLTCACLFLRGRATLVTH